MERLEITLFLFFKKRASGSIDSGHFYLVNLADFCCFSSFIIFSLFKSLELLQDVMAKSVPSPGDKLYDLVSLVHRRLNQHEQDVLEANRGNVSKSKYKTSKKKKKKRQLIKNCNIYYIIKNHHLLECCHLFLLVICYLFMTHLLLHVNQLSFICINLLFILCDFTLHAFLYIYSTLFTDFICFSHMI